MDGISSEGKTNHKTNFQKTLGQQIKSVRLAKGITAAEMGKRMEMERSHVARLEAGNTNPTAATLRLVCLALEIEFSDLFEGFRIELDENKKGAD